MIILIIGILILVIGTLFLIIDLDNVCERVKNWKSKVNLGIYRVFRPVCEVFVYVKNFFGKIFKTAGR